MHLSITYALFLFPVAIAELISEQDNKVFPFKTPVNCRKSEFYDLDYFTCVNCDSGSNLVPTIDRFSCKCLHKTETAVLFDSVKQSPICDSSTCKNCEDPIKIKCKLKYINNIRNGTALKSIQIFQDSSRNCSCNPKSFSTYHDFCISNTLLKPFLGFQTFDQGAIFTDLKFIAFFCRVLRNTTACNHLANLCVMSFYNQNKNSPCSLFLLAQTSDAAFYGGEDLKNIRPFVFYQKGKGTVQDISKVIDFTYSLSDRDEGRKMNFFTTIYSLDGVLERMGTLNPQQINLCRIFTSQEKMNIEFAKNIETSCRFSLGNIIDLARIFANKHFLNIYLNYTIDEVEYLQPVPILIRDIFSNEKNNKPEDWQLVKRFQLISAQQRFPHFNFGPFYEDVSKLKHFKSILFPKKIEIRSSIREGSKISSPIISIHYRTIEVVANSSLEETYSFTFEVVFTKKNKLNFWFEVILPFFMAIAFAFALLRTFNYKTRQNKEFYDFPALVQFALHLFSNSANAFFAVATGFSFYTFFVYFYQKTVKILLPVENEDAVEILIYLAAVLKGIYLIDYFWSIGKVDLFFIDWERPRGYDTHVTYKGNLDTPSMCSSARSSINEGGVSAWRIFFVANEWIQLAMKRKASILTQLIIFLATMQILEIKFKAQLVDRTIKLAVVILVYSSIYLLQILHKLLIWERICGNPLQKFVDICSIANISVFILVHDSYGYYIHGRSPHGFSDTDMSSMIIQLQRESYNMSGKRGLLTGSDHQTYVILAPTDLRTYYSKLLAPFLKAANISQNHFEKEFVNHKSRDGSFEKTAIAYSSVNRFFCAFVDHAIKDLDYIIKEKTFMESFLDCEFDNYLTENKGTFYIDGNNAFGKVFLYGNEFQIFLFELFLFTSFFIATNEVTAAAVITCIIILFIGVIFQLRMKTNVANKTLIDKRFLM